MGDDEKKKWQATAETLGEMDYWKEFLRVEAQLKGLKGKGDVDQDRKETLKWKKNDCLHSLLVDAEVLMANHKSFH